MPFLNTIVSFFVKSKIERIEHFSKNPEIVQNQVFKKIIQRGLKTEFGEKYNFKSINSFNDYQKNVPISTYEDLFPYIQRMMKGETNILWDAPVKTFAKSSGTTNDRSKYIPLPDETLHEIHYQGGKDLIAVYLHNNPNSNFFLGKGIALGGSLEYISNDIVTGDLSAHIMHNLPFWAEFMRAPDIETALKNDYEEKLELIIKKTIDKNITNISGVPTWAYVLLNKILEHTNTKNILEVWPNFEWYAHGGVSFKPYNDLFDNILPKNKVKYTEIYNASEGFFALQDRNDSDELLLMLDYPIFYEFIPLSNFQNNNFNSITISDVELNTNYVLIISVLGGLWRYVIGDTIYFTCKHPFRIKISGRTKHFINVFGEELIIDNAEEGLKYACLKTNSTIKDYTVAPVFLSEKNKGKHQWLIEFENKPEDLTIFSNLLDQKLREINSDYDAKRYNNIALENLEVTVAPINTFYNWLKSKNKLGGQNKIPRLSNEREIIESILKLINF